MVKVCTKIFKAPNQGIRTDGYYLDGNLKDNLQLAKDVIKKDWDMVFIVDGAEGAGKSVLAQQIGFFCDNTLNMSRITFTPEEFKKAVLSAGKYECVIFDEAYGGLSSRKAMTDVNKGLVAMLTEIRQKNLFIIVVLPTFFDLDRYVALWRSRMLLHVYADNFERGSFTFYSYNKKKSLYVNGKKFYSYRAEKPAFRGSFTNFYTVDKKEYKKAKYESLKNYEERVESPELRARQATTKLYEDMTRNLNRLQHKFKLTNKDCSEILDIGRRTIQRHLENIRASAECS